MSTVRSLCGFRMGAMLLCAVVLLLVGEANHLLSASHVAVGHSAPLSLLGPTAEPGPKIAITFDDLPAHGSLPPGETRMEVISKIIAALREAHAPPAYGFVNGARLEQQPAEVAVLRVWFAAGYPLANHSWSHMNLNQHSLDDFEQDVIRNEPVLMNLTKDKNWRWFRYPFLAEGNTPEKKAGFRYFLRQRHYKIAAVTMSFGDYLWNEPYARCRTKADPSAIASLEDSFLAAADQSIGYYRSLSRTLYQRDIPYVLLMHVGAFDAEMLPRLLQMYRAKGFQFVTLSEAERDDFYRGATDLNLAAGPETLEEAMSARQLTLPSRTDFAPQLDSFCR